MRVYNFSAGPAALPLPVLEKAAAEMVNYNNSGMSVMEMSHRSKEFSAIISNAKEGIIKTLDVPDDYSVLFLQGGASHQFAMVPMNLAIEGKSIGMIHTGAWTKKAIAEIKKISKLNLIASSEDKNFSYLPSLGQMSFDSDDAYVHLASNNTIYGTQWKVFPDTGEISLVADMSSDILSRKINVSDFGLIFAGAQKNIGPAGVTLVIIKNELAERAPESLPNIMQYRNHIKNDSLYNTPPAYSIYIVGLVMEWIASIGGISAIEKVNEDKASLLYEALDKTNFYNSPVAQKDRSLMNVVYRIQDGNEELEKIFISEASKQGLSGLKGHRSVGGIRASIYNAHPAEGVKALVDFMSDFEKKYG